MQKILKFRIAGALVILSLVGAFPSFAQATHTWGGYHWARTTNPFTLRLGDNLTSNWKPYLVTTSTDWTLSSVLNTTIVPGQSNPKTCKPVTGRVEICNSKYGQNGWLGIASVWASGQHITQGTVKMNDTYYSLPKYNTAAWRNLVMCQEVGHTLGLAHQDENFDNANLDSCMDYTNDPATNQHPNDHDYSMLESIYTHLDSTTSVISGAATNRFGASQVSLNDRQDWGQEIRTAKNGSSSVFYRKLNGQEVFTFVVWADPSEHEHDHE
jgi:hypothetical protein